ncbi:MAG: nucleoside recognition domain-containing protein [Bacteroidota bacterium]|nr:nucleoside recognition domain-containing protein [Bacteroidota bacterium]
MLNHIWLALIVIGILTAAGRDVYDVTQNSFGNGIPWEVRLEGPDGEVTGTGQGTTVQATLHVSAAQLRAHFSTDAIAADAALPARVTFRDDGSASAQIDVRVASAGRFTVMAEALGGGETLAANLRRAGADWEMRVDDVSLVYLRKVTNAAFEIAGLAVEIALGLIGIMALWLGVMKVAEEAGLITHLARLVRPITVRLFPDVPAEHPAVGSMIMNISANMLGLGNAATPFGLKAMEELEKLNPKSGVATDAMVTFLALNTSCVTLIPATAIAVRAAAGSSDPAFIIGTSFLASLTATIFAVTISKLLSRVKMFRFDRAEAN